MGSKLSSKSELRVQGILKGSTLVLVPSSWSDKGGRSTAFVTGDDDGREHSPNVPVEVTEVVRVWSVMMQ